MPLYEILKDIVLPFIVIILIPTVVYVFKSLRDLDREQLKMEARQDNFDDKLEAMDDKYGDTVEDLKTEMTEIKTDIKELLRRSFSSNRGD